MSTNWKAIVHADNASRYVLPAGFDSDEAIGKALGCSAEKAREVMKPLVKDRKAERRECIVWDSQLKRTVRVIAYRLITQRAA